MFGLEKDPGEGMFEFDLEKDIKSDPEKKLAIQKEVEGKIRELKTILREGSKSEEEFENYGVLLRGYASLQKVINRIDKQK